MIDTETSRRRFISYEGSLSKLYLIWLSNLALMLITLFIYRPWAKSRMRKHIWSHLSIEQESLRYLGTGGELFMGLLKLGILLIFFQGIIAAITFGYEFYEKATPESYEVGGLEIDNTPETEADAQTSNASESVEISNEEIYAQMRECGYTAENWNEVTDEIYQDCMSGYVQQLMESQEYSVAAEECDAQNEEGCEVSDLEFSWSFFLIKLILLTVIPFLFTYYLWFFSRYSALRYRLTRTSWRGVRGRMTGSPHYFARLSFKRMFLNIISFGYLIPSSEFVKQTYLMRDMYYGSQKVIFTPQRDRLAHLNRLNIITLILVPFTLFLSRLWYVAAMKNAKLAGTRFGEVQFSGTYTGPALLKHYLINILLLIVSFGLAMPVILSRTLHFHTSHIFAEGALATAHILQENGTSETWGEGIADDYDTGFDLDFGPI